MKVSIHGDKIKVTPAIKEHIENKITKLSKYFADSDELSARVAVRVSNNNQIIEVTLPTQKFTLRAEESHKDLYAATDLVIDKLERQIRKNKTRINNRFHQEQRVPDFNFNFEEKEENIGKIVKRKEIESKPMGEEEAILQMELINHEFFVFDDIDNECVSVVYKRKDGNYGIINMK